MSTAIAVPIHSEHLRSQRLPVLTTAHRAADRAEDAKGIVGKSEALQLSLRQARIVAPTDSTVVIYGEPPVQGRVGATRCSLDRE